MKLQTVSLNNSGLTLIEVLIASVVTLVLFLALMQAALLSIEINAGNSLRNEAVSIAEERMREIRRIASSDDFNDIESDDADVDLGTADCPQEFVDDFGTDGRLIQRPFRNRQQPIDFCTNLTCVVLDDPTDPDCATSSGDMKQLNVTLGWIWQGEDYIHRMSTIVRRP